MRRFVVLLFLLSVSARLGAQTKQEFIASVRANINSFPNLMTFLKKMIPGPRSWDQANVFLGAKGYSTFIILKNAGSISEYGDFCHVKLIYKGEETLYLSIIQRNWVGDDNEYKPDTLFRYTNPGYLSDELALYNKDNGTILTWRDLFEDEISCFTIEPGLGYWKKGEPRTIWERVYVPLVLARDRVSVLRECKSINPVRRAYGAFALYYFQKNGQVLTEEEIVLLDEILHSKTQIDFSQGCDLYRDMSTDEVLKISIADYFR